jgi:hypothetical protein
MSRKELLGMIREIAKILFLDDESMTHEEKIIRVKNILVDILTESEAPPKFGAN